LNIEKTVAWLKHEYHYINSQVYKIVVVDASELKCST